MLRRAERNWRSSWCSPRPARCGRRRRAENQRGQQSKAAIKAIKAAIKAIKGVSIALSFLISILLFKTRNHFDLQPSNPAIKGVSIALSFLISILLFKTRNHFDLQPAALSGHVSPSACQAPG
jgi:hypothetical protein